MRLPHTCIHALQEGYSYISVQMPCSIDVSLSDIAAHCENTPLAYWQTPSEDLALLGIGNALSSPLHSLEDLRRGQDALRDAVYEVFVDDGVGAGDGAGASDGGDAGDGDSAREGDSDRDGAGFIALGASLYDLADMRAQRLADRQEVWGELSEGYFFVPAILIRASARSCTITFNIEAHCAQELSQRWQELSDYSHELLERCRLACAAPSVTPTQSCGTHAGDITAVTPTSLICEETFSRERWASAISSIKAELTEPDPASPLKKVVLARQLHLKAPAPINVHSVIKRIHNQQPYTYTFMLTARDRSFISATPERLLWADSCELRSASIAGSAPRGKTPAEDEQLESQLLSMRRIAMSIRWWWIILLRSWSLLLKLFQQRAICTF